MEFIDKRLGYITPAHSSSSLNPSCVFPSPHSDAIKERPIGIFDSGLGGFSILEDILKLLKNTPHSNESFIYLADNYNLPYGNKSRSQIISYVKNAIRFFIQKEVKAIVIACNTASSFLSPLLLEETFVIEEFRRFGFFPPIIGTILPFVPWFKRYVAKKKYPGLSIASKKDRILLLATLRTIEEKVYSQALTNEGYDVEELACPDLVSLVEEGVFAQNPLIDTTIEYYLSLATKNHSGKFPFDYILLACTHFPHLIENFKKIVGTGTDIITPGPALSDTLIKYMDREQLICTNVEPKPWIRVYSTLPFSTQGHTLMENILRKKPMTFETVCLESN